MSDSLHRVLDEARRDLGTEEVRRVDWEAVDKRLFASIEAAQRAERGSLARGRIRPWSAVAASLLLAAAVALAVGRTRERHPLEQEHVAAMDDAGSIIGIEGEGEVLLDGRPAAVGAVLKLGDFIETHGAQTTLGRLGKLTLVVERGSSVTVTHTQGALVLALAQGSMEAQVVPVASGEALAVDVGPSRVAIHGTHVRVARTGEHVTMDLNEGVVSVGAAPRVGSTLGALVAAPAHAEFSDGDAQGTLLVTHDPADVRAPIALAAAPQPKPMSGASAPAVSKDSHDATQVAPLAFPRIDPRPQTNASGAAAWPTPAGDPNAQAVVASAVRACMAERLHSDDVTVVVTTTLYLQLRDDGSVHSAHFDPPVAPDVNACAAQSIYKARFTQGGAVTIPVSVKN